jgi:hypothetical protein
MSGLISAAREYRRKAPPSLKSEVWGRGGGGRVTQLKGHPMRLGDGVVRNLRQAAIHACVALPWADVSTVMVEGRPLRTRRMRSSHWPSSQHGTMIFSAKKIEATHSWDWVWL